MNLPNSFLERMKGILPKDFPLFLSALESQSAVRAIRLNEDKIDASTFFAALEEDWKPVPYAKCGFYTDYEKIGNHPLHHAGAFYVQDPGAMATVHALSVERGWRVADLCAAPGGKSTQLSALVGEDGFLLSNEISVARCKVLAGNLERLGTRNAVLTNTDIKTFASRYCAYFDLVLVDAPCSGEGMFRKYDYAVEEWSEDRVLACAERQNEILALAATAVKGGGYLLYSTCTFSLEENEMVIDRFLTENEAFTVVPVLQELRAATADGIPFPGCRYPEALVLARRFYPHLSPGEGQFICLLRRADEGTEESISYRDTSEKLSKQELESVESFLKSVLRPEAFKKILPKFNIRKAKESVCLVPKDFPIPPYGVYLCGVTIGSLVKGRIVPHHQFFSAFGKYFSRTLAMDLCDDRLRQYLHGDTVPCDLSDGYAVVTVCGCALGGVKVVSGVAKNHYPKGLRLS